MGKVKHGKRYYKQMSLEVAVRNPERYDGILRIFSKFEGRTLDDATILEIYTQLYIDGVVTTTDIDTTSMSIDTIADYIKETKSHNNEWGFPTGYQAGFTRYLKTLSEFGFIYSQYNEVLRLSEVAKAVVNNVITLSEAFALQCMRFWRKSPYRRVLNDFNYFKFILYVIQRLNDSGRKLSYPQFMLSLFSDNGDADMFMQIISDNKIGNDLDKAYELATSLYSEIDDEHLRVNKMSTSFNDYGNTVFRVLQLTGFITIEYQGTMLLSINSMRKQLLEALINENFSITETAQEDENEYFEILGHLSTHLLTILVSNRDNQKYSVSDYNMKLHSIIDSYNLTEEYVAKYLRDVSIGKSDGRVFWFLQAPLKFEFLLSLYLMLCYGDEFEYKPNYLCDESGIPYSHAPGNIGDIEVFNDRIYWLVEATLIKGKTQQINNETINLFRHIDQTKKSAKYMSLIAPCIHDDTELLIKVATVISMIDTQSLIFSKPYSIDEFLEHMSDRSCMDDMQSGTVGFIKKLNKQIQRLDAAFNYIN